ncbi:MAG: DUF29 domain-containing protein [Runella slithyformis]|nr:MAG: DUF29 domain-containing protein [Runella slithyformis]
MPLRPNITPWLKLKNRSKTVIIKTLLDVMARAEKRALESQLMRLMWHILKWKIQPEKRSVSWIITIDNARDEIEAEKKYSPSLNDAFVLSIWGNVLSKARRNAEKETNLSTKDILELTWEEVFEMEYSI